MTRVTSNKNLAVLVKAATQQGWEVTRANGGHVKWVSPDGEIVTTSSSPSDGNAIHQIRRDLEGAGLKLDGPPRRVRRGRAPALLNVMGDSFWDALNAASDDYETGKEMLMERARVVLNLPRGSGPAIAAALESLSPLQKKIAMELIAAVEEPSHVCACGRSFAGYLGAEMHRRKCVMGAEPVEPEIELIPVPDPGTIPPMPTQTTPEPTRPIQQEPTTTMPSSLRCEECNREFASSQGLGAHRRSHQIRACEFCGREVPANTIGQHQTHCEHNPDAKGKRGRGKGRKRKVACPDCGKQVQIASLKPHNRLYCAVAEYKRNNPELVAMDTEAVVVPQPVQPVQTTQPIQPQPVADNGFTPSTQVYNDEYLDTLLNIVVDNKSIPVNFTTMKAINEWIECTRKLLTLVHGER